MSSNTVKEVPEWLQELIKHADKARKDLEQETPKLTSLRWFKHMINLLDLYSDDEETVELDNQAFRDEPWVCDCGRTNNNSNKVCFCDNWCCVCDKVNNKSLENCHVCEDSVCPDCYYVNSKYHSTCVNCKKDFDYLFLYED